LAFQDIRGWILKVNGQAPEGNIGRILIVATAESAILGDQLGFKSLSFYLGEHAVFISPFQCRRKLSASQTSAYPLFVHSYAEANYQEFNSLISFVLHGVKPITKVPQAWNDIVLVIKTLIHKGRNNANLWELLRKFSSALRTRNKIKEKNVIFRNAF